MRDSFRTNGISRPDEHRPTPRQYRVYRSYPPPNRTHDERRVESFLGALILGAIFVLAVLTLGVFG